MRRLGAGLLLACAAALGAGCGGTAHVSGASTVGMTASERMAVRFPGAADIISGLELADSTGQWRTGDQILLGLAFSRGASRTERLLLVELLEEPGRRPRFRRTVGVFGDEVRIDSPTRATRLRVFDADGAPLSDNRGQLAEIFLDYGPWEVARIGGGYAIATGAGEETPENPHPEISLEDLRPGVYGMMSLLAFGEGAGDNPTLSGLMEKAFTMGQKLGLLLSMGRFEIRIGAAVPLAPDSALSDPGWPADAYETEIRVSVNGKLALVGPAVLAPTVSPLGLAGGILLGELTNEADPDIRASVVLLSARRGPAGANSVTTDAKAGG